MRKFTYLLAALAIALPSSAQVPGSGNDDVTSPTGQQFALNAAQATQEKVEVCNPKKISAQFAPYIATYKSLQARTFGDGGRQVRMAQVGDSLVIADVVLANSVFKAGVNGSQLSIPVPYSVGRVEGVGNVDLVALKMEGTAISPDTEVTEITGTLADDETVTFNGMFGLITTETENLTYYYAGQNLMIQKGNATMTMNYYGMDVSYSILAKQHDGVVTLTNFGNTGLTFDAPLTTDREIAIGGGKFARLKPASSFLDFMVAGIQRYTENPDGTILPRVYNTALTATAVSNRTVEWGMWCGTNSAGTYWIGPYMNGRIDFTEDIVYPTAPSLEGLTGSGTKTDPYLIPDTDTWLAVAANVEAGNTNLGKYFRVTADLDFSNNKFAPIGVASGFRGFLDGDGHTVTVNNAGGTSPCGLIGRLGENAVVRNLNSAGSFAFGDVQNTGGIVGIAYANSLVENCVNNADITSGGLGVGGVVGHSYTGAEIRNCKNTANIHYTGTNNSSWVAGICGYAQGTNLFDCANEGTFTIDEPTKAGCIGGVISYGTFNDSIVNCYNTADITGLQYVAGVQAYCAQMGIGWTVYQNCYNNGDISLTTTATNIPVGGAFSHVIAGSQLIDCYNTGNVTAVGCSSAGGVVGRYLGTTNDTMEDVMLFKRCYNTGNVTTTATGNTTVGGVLGFGNVVVMDSCYNSGDITSSKYIAGGLVGQLQNRNPNSYVTNCYNIGNVTGGYWVGGLFGNLAFDKKVDNVWNSGTVTANSRAGGIAGYSAYGGRISRAFNVGDVVLLNTAAGTGNNSGHAGGGIAGHYAGYITDSYNAGNIIGVSRTAGILASPYRGNATQDNVNYIHNITNCYNTGELINALADSCGNIVGVHTINNGTVWREYGYMIGDNPAQYLDTLQNCYYLNTINPDVIVEDVPGQVGLNSANLCNLEISDNFTSVGDYCYPVLATQTENPHALLYAAAVVPVPERGSSEVITKDFNVGAPDGLRWSSSYAGLTINGNNAMFSDDAYQGEITLTATFGNISREIVIQVDKPEYTAVDNIRADKQVKSVRYYNAQGVRVDADYDGMLIKVTQFTDGTQSSSKIMK